VTYRDQQRRADIQAAIDAIRSHLRRGDLTDSLVFDAVRIRLLEIGEAVKALPAELLDTQPAIPWRQVARMRDHIAHRYFDTAHHIIQATVDEDLPPARRRRPGHDRRPARRPAASMTPAGQAGNLHDPPRNPGHPCAAHRPRPAARDHRSR
jgi:uncharacterized protein with HEPN domain